MSQSCTSVPPLNLDDINDEIYEDDPRGDVSLGYLGIGSRFSDISIEERKDRINVTAMKIAALNAMTNFPLARLILIIL